MLREGGGLDIFVPARHLDNRLRQLEILIDPGVQAVEPGCVVRDLLVHLADDAMQFAPRLLEQMAGLLDRLGLGLGDDAVNGVVRLEQEAVDAAAVAGALPLMRDEAGIGGIDRG